MLLRNEDCPLVHKILLGPIDEECKMVLTEKRGVQEVSPEVRKIVNNILFVTVFVRELPYIYASNCVEHQVAPFFILPEAVLFGFLDALQKEQDEVEANIRAR